MLEYVNYSITQCYCSSYFMKLWHEGHLLHTKPQNPLILFEPALHHFPSVTTRSESKSIIQHSALTQQQEEEQGV